MMMETMRMIFLVWLFMGYGFKYLGKNKNTVEIGKETPHFICFFIDSWIINQLIRLILKNNDTFASDFHLWRKLGEILKKPSGF